MNPPNSPQLDFSDVETTALLMLYARAIDSRSQNPILLDPHAGRLVEQIDPLIANASSPLLRILYRRQVEPNLVVHAALRAQKYDQVALEFLARHPGGVLVNLGCGLDTRFQRLDNGQLRLFDLDLPSMIRFKRRLLPENERYTQIAASVFDPAWLDQLTAAGGIGPYLFIAEGLFMYLPPEQVRRFVIDLSTRFPGSELVCEVVNRFWATGLFGKMTALKMQRQLKLGPGTAYTFGLASPDEMQTWAPGIEFLDRWSYFETNHPRLGWMRLFRHIKMMNDVQYTVRYRFR